MPEALTAPSPAEVLRRYNVEEAPRLLADVEAEAQSRNALFNMPAGIEIQPFVVLCSVWPERLVSQPFSHGGIGRKYYYMEPGSAENPSYLIVQKTFYYTQFAQRDEPISYVESPVFAPGLAQNLIQFWTGDHPGNKRGKKGIGIIQGERVPVKDKVTGEVKYELKATAQEIATLVKQQKDFLGFIVERADQHWDSARPGDRERATSPEPRKALKLLGLDETQHPWFRSKIKQYSPCPRCDSRISTNAIGCKDCGVELAKFFMDRDEIPSADEWPRVVKEIERLTARKGGK